MSNGDKPLTEQQRQEEQKNMIQETVSAAISGKDKHNSISLL